MENTAGQRSPRQRVRPGRGLTFRIRLILAFLLLSLLPIGCLVYLSIVLPEEYDNRDREQLAVLAQTLRREVAELGEAAFLRLEELCKPGGLAEFLLKNYLIDSVDPLRGGIELESFAKQFVHLSDFDLLDLLDRNGRTLFSRHAPERYLRIDQGDLQALENWRGRPIVRFETSWPLDLLSIQAVSRSESWKGRQLIISAGYRIDQSFIERLDQLTGAAILLRPSQASSWLLSSSASRESLLKKLQAQETGWLERLSQTVGEPVELGEGAYNLIRLPLYANPLATNGQEPLADFVIGRNRKAVENLIFKTRMLLASMVLGVLLVSWIAAVLLSARMTGPINRLVTAAHGVAKGDLDLRVPSVPGRELSVLVQAFNTMTQRLKHSQSNLLRAERIAAWREIARRLAHEIKNPLFPIQLSIQNLKKTWERQHPDFEEIFEESTSTILQEVERLKHIVNEFSQFARMPKLQRKPEALNELIRSAAARYRGLPSGIQLELELSPELPLLLLDREKIHQILLNLLNNAVDAMPEGGKITLRTRLSPEEDQVLLEIQDSGGGIEEALIPQLFRPYFTTKQGGTGLGLAIVLRILLDHGGRIQVESRSGQGTSFFLFFPTRLSEGELSQTQQEVLEDLNDFPSTAEHSSLQPGKALDGE